MTHGARPIGTYSGESVEQLEARIRTLIDRGEATNLAGYREKIFLDRYAIKDSEGKPVEHHPEQMWLRVAKAIAAVEPEDRRAEWTHKFYDVLSDFRFVPGGRILSGAGSGTDVTYYNCFVTPSPEDSVQGIFDNIAVAAEIMRRSGGVGVNLSTLRPRGAYIKTVNGTASGPCSWGILYSDMTGKVIIQGGSRRGALMLMLDDDHPDVEEFVEYKRKNPGHIDHANLSVAVSDAFMQAVKEDKPWELKWKGEVWRTIRARDLWRKIAESAWAYAEPGVVWMDRYNKVSNTHYFENIRCVNPCGEQGLPPYGVCNLGALNLVSFVKTLDGETYFDYDDLAQASRTCIRFLDDVIDATNYPFDENREAQQNGTRRTGLGTMGIADVLIRMGLRYGSSEAMPVVERIYKTIRDAAYDESSRIAAEKGAFPKFDREQFMQGEFIKQLPREIQDRIAEHGIRNGVLLTQAPTGTTSSLAGVNSGIEPVFAFVTRRTDRLGEHLLYHPLAQEWKDAHPDEALPDYFVASGDLTPHEHITIQAVVQRYTDSSISKTVNGPSTDTVEFVEQLYLDAYDLGCKGVTYYRQGSRDAVLEAVTEKKAEPTNQPEEVKQTPETVPAAPVQVLEPTIKSRPTVVQGYTRQVRAPEGKVNITLNSDEAGLLEIFINLGKAGTDIAAMAEALGRLISLNLQLPSPMTADQRAWEMADQLRGIGGSRTVGFGPGQVKSLPDAVGQALIKHLERDKTMPAPAADGQAGASATPAHGLPAPAQPETNGGHGVGTNGNGSALASVPASVSPQQLLEKTVQLTGNLCPGCGCNSLVHQEGCRKCIVCGHSEC
jgi:ribonucleoside-diphosphate reductase alpha chain